MIESPRGVVRRAPAIGLRTAARRPLPAGRGSFRCGLTLVELMVAMVFVALVLPAIMRGFSTSTRAATSARQLSEASQLAHGKLEELIALQAWNGGAMQGDFGPDWPDYRWAAQIIGWDTRGVSQLDLTVTWLGHGGERAFTLSTLVYTPPFGSGSGDGDTPAGSDTP